MRVSHILTLIFPFLGVSASFADQQVISPPAMVEWDPLFSPVTTGKPTLTDLLTIESSASIYFSYARETTFSTEFSTADNQLTLLVPTNKAVMALPRKPHQGTVDPEIQISEEQYDQQSKHNVERWVAAHIIPFRVSLSDAPVVYDTLLDSKSITVTPVSEKEGSPDWSKVTLEDGIRIIGMKEAENGVIYMIDGAINPN